jgi:hypothetical protein
MEAMDSAEKIDLLEELESTHKAYQGRAMLLWMMTCWEHILIKRSFHDKNIFIAERNNPCGQTRIGGS